MPLTIVRNDITKMNVDAIVNVAKPDLKKGRGVCGAIFRAAGEKSLKKACGDISPVKTGEAVITNGFALPAKYIVHTSKPTYLVGKHNIKSLLFSCYKNSLDLARSHGCKSIAFTLITCRVFYCSKSEALAVATKAISDWLMTNDMDISLVIANKKAFAPSKKLLNEIKEFIDKNYHSVPNAHVMQMGAISGRKGRHIEKHAKPTKMYANMRPAELSATLPDFIGNLDEPFSETLLRLVDEKGKTDVQVYRRANIDRRLFSKIRTGNGYMPSKKTVVALAVALELSLPETRALLERAGYALSRSMMFDVIIEFFITHGWYDIFEINNVLYEYDQPLLESKQSRDKSDQQSE